MSEASGDICSKERPRSHSARALQQRPLAGVPWIAPAPSEHQPRSGPPAGFFPGDKFPQGRPSISHQAPLSTGHPQTVASGLCRRLSDPPPAGPGCSRFDPMRATPPPWLPPLTRQVRPEVAFAERAEAAVQRSHVPGGGGGQDQSEQPEDRAPGQTASPSNSHPVESRFRPEAAHRLDL